MKKLLLSALCALVAFTANSQSLVFNGNLEVTVDGKGGSMPAEVSLTPGRDDNHMNLSLNNFRLSDGENDMYIGNILIEDVNYEEDTEDPEGSSMILKCSRNITIQPGTAPKDAEWLGPMLGEIPVVLEGKFDTENMQLNVNIDIDFKTLGQIIKVKFNSEYCKIMLTDDLKVTVNGQSATQPISVFLGIAGYDEESYAPIINFSLPNLKLQQGDDAMYVGTIHVNDIKLYPISEESDIFTFSYKGDLLIEEGDLEGVETWMGPLLGPVPLDLKGEFDLGKGKLHFVIDIDMQESIGQIINVEFGKTFTEGIQQAIQKALSGSLCFGIDGKVAQKGILIQNGKKIIK